MTWQKTLKIIKLSEDGVIKANSYIIGFPRFDHCSLWCQIRLVQLLKILVNYVCLKGSENWSSMAFKKDLFIGLVTFNADKHPVAQVKNLAAN